MIEETLQEKHNRVEDVLIQVKLLINRYYEQIGRFGEVNVDEVTELVEQIDNLVNSARLDKRKLILNTIEKDDNI